MRVAETTADALVVRASLAGRGEVIVTREGLPSGRCQQHHLVCPGRSGTWRHGAATRAHRKIAAHLSDAQAAASKAETALPMPTKKRYQDLRVQATQQWRHCQRAAPVHNLEVERLQIEQARAGD